jgi:hypothetical protein
MRPTTPSRNARSCDATSTASCRAAKEVETQAEQIERERELVQRYRSHRKFSKMHEHEARLERLEADRRDVPKMSRKLEP